MNPLLFSKLAKAPVYKCFMSSEVIENGMGTAVITRLKSDDEILIARFLCDSYCLGIKDTHIDLTKKKRLSADLTARHPEDFHEESPDRVVKFLIDLEKWARSIGFEPVPSYAKAKKVFESIDTSTCDEHFEFGKDGKPFYFRGPRESAEQANRIISILEKNCGEGNYDYMVQF